MSQVPTQRDTSTDTETHIDARARLCAVCNRGDRGCVSLEVWSLSPAAAAASSARAVVLARAPRALLEMETETETPGSRGAESLAGAPFLGGVCSGHVDSCVSRTSGPADSSISSIQADSSISSIHAPGVQGAARVGGEPVDARYHIPRYTSL